MPRRRSRADADRARDGTGAVRAPSAQGPVMVCVAAGDRPDPALLLGAEIALRSGKPLELINVPPNPRTVSLARAPANLAALEAAVRYVLARGDVTPFGLTGSRSPVQIRGVVRHRRGLRHDLLDAATEMSAVVVMRRRLSRLHRLLVDSTSLQLAAYSPVPTFVVPEFWASWHGVHRRVVLVQGSGARSRLPDDMVALVRGPTHVVEESRMSGVRDARGLVEMSRTADLLLVGRRSPGLLAGATRTLLDEAHCPVGVLPVADPCGFDLEGEPSSGRRERRHERRGDRDGE